MLVELTMALMQGVSQALVERFVRNREQSASVKDVLKEVEQMKTVQISDRRMAAELRKQMAAMIARTDGLEIHRRRIVFAPTNTTQTPESALLNLDLEISRLRSERESAAESRAQVNSARQDEGVRTVSILDGIDDEIEQLRAGAPQPGVEGGHR